MEMQLQYGMKFNTFGVISAQKRSERWKQRCLSPFYTFAGGEEVVSKTQIIGKHPKDDLAYTQQQILPKLTLKMQLRGPDFSSVPSDSCLNPASHTPLLAVSVYKLHSTSIYDLQVLLKTHVSAVMQWYRQDHKFCFK